ncbi:hypothetical protein C900_01206 [Fulvivirga imtechensis AK7]|uniref:Uncharacterized protein n=1 Tax=Fulvivirga imtechensis AK7 TaxID=1237149 RepID=L8JGU6_9BACT|nr:hypothetical protein C900_01206 [Fulvivirga imtechensis AK7]
MSSGFGQRASLWGRYGLTEGEGEQKQGLWSGLFTIAPQGYINQKGHGNSRGEERMASKGRKMQGGAPFIFLPLFLLSTEKIKENDLAVFRTAALTTHRKHTALPCCFLGVAKCPIKKHLSIQEGGFVRWVLYLNIHNGFSWHHLIKFLISHFIGCYLWYFSSFNH